MAQTQSKGLGNGFAFSLAVVLLATFLSVNVVEAAKRPLPPDMFRESPNERVQPRADENLDYRLPNTTTPVHYAVTLTTYVDSGNRTFEGTVKIDIIVETATKTIVLHQRQLTILAASIQRRDGSDSKTLTFTTEAEREFLTLTSSDELAKDSEWTVVIAYKGELRTDNGGFYLSTYQDEFNQTKYLATTQFESTDARHAFPCYDEPAKRAKFSFTINHAVSYGAISNMPINEEKSQPGISVFDTTPDMPTYLTAFIISQFEWTEGVLNALPQRIYSRPGTRHDQEWALVSGMLIIERLAEYYDVAFELPKIYQVAVPDFAAGAMENWGLATYREEYMLYNKERSTVNTQTNIANIIAHEYCHQWFGNLVAVKWWTYLWMKEGFATLFSWQATDDAYPEWDVWQMFHTDDYQRALLNDGSNSPRPMTHYVQKPNEISRLYDSVSYSKAGSVLHMFQHALTDQVFRQGLKNYLTRHRISAAEEDDLFESIQTAATENNYPLKATVKEMMSSWTRQGGVPLLTVERNYDTGAFTVKQEAFYNDETYKQEKSWFIPINYAVQSNPDFRNTEATHYLLNETQISVDAKVSKDDWLIVNKQSTGYYRINYDERNWNLIIDGLIARSHKIHPRNRAQFMHDAYRFSTSNRLSHEILLKLLTYLPNEDQYAPWSTANAIITTFNRYLSGDQDYANFKSFIAEMVKNIYDKLGVNDIPGEQHLQKYTRSVAINLACLAGIESCLQETNDKLKALIEKGIEIEPNLQSQTYCNGLKQSGDNEFNFVYNKLMTSNDQAQRRILISSLGCAQKESHVKKFIESSTDKTNQLRTQERITLLSAAYSRGEVGLLASIEFLDNNWQEYGDLTTGFGGSNPLDDDIRGMSQYVVNDNQEKKLLALVEKVKNSDKVTATLESSVNANIKANMDWLKQNRDPLMNWVNTFGHSGSASLSASFLSLGVAILVLVRRMF